jgi:hypothetical protein
MPNVVERLGQVPCCCQARTSAIGEPVATRFPLSSRLTIQVTEVGLEREPVMLIDGFAALPEHLVDAAACSSFEPAYGPAGGYPGLRAPAPLDYVAVAVRALTRPIGEAFALGPVRPVRAECNFSLVTLPPDTLVAAQRAPHVDTADPDQFAILHYLCDARFGGTAFFRHRATGFEAITPERWANFEAVRAGEGASGGYVGSDDPWFKQTGEVDAAFNRLVVYRSRLLHSGRILDPAALSPDPRRGRLTANIFATFRSVA